MKPTKNPDKIPDEVNALIQQKINRAISWDNSKLSKERERVTRYYNGEYPKRKSEGNASFISNDVYDGVESMKSQLLETFAGGLEIVKFDPQSEMDVVQADIQTKYTDYVLFRQNKGYSILSQVIHDALIARVGIVHIWWEKVEAYEPESFDNLSREEVMGLVGQEQVTDLEADVDPKTGLYSGSLVKKITKEQVRIALVNPEEFFIDPVAKELDPRYFCGHRTIKTMDELEGEGYDVSKIVDYNYENDATLQMLPEVLARFQQMNTVSQATTDDDVQDALRHVLVYECYAQLKLKGDKRAFLYQVIKVGDHVISLERVDELPYLVFTPLPIPHAFLGNNFAARIIPTQNVRTVLTRAVIDHTSTTVNPRWQVVKGGLTNPRELLDNRLGGIVNVTRPDAVSPLMQPNLNPFVFQTLEMVKASNEETTGISSLSQGLNKDAISNQNSQGMVNDLVNLSQTRQKIIARNFAYGFLVPLYVRISNLVLMHEKKQNVVELAGQWVPIDPRLWCERKSATVSLHLGYGEHDREAATRMQIGAALMQNPQTARMFTGVYKYTADIFRLKGMPNVSDYLTDPAKLPPPQPDPKAQMELYVMKTEADAKMLTAQANMAKVSEHSKLDSAKSAIKASQLQSDQHLKVVEENRKVADTRHKIDIGNREMVLAEQAGATQGQAIISPH